MSSHAIRRVALAACAFALCGCTGLLSEKPLFAPADYDASGALLGHYAIMKGDTTEGVIVSRGAGGGLVFVGLKSVPGKAKDETTWVQTIYAEGAAVPLGDGDYALQISCSGLVEKGRIYASWFGGRRSPYRQYTAYGVLARDRKADHYWVNANFYSSNDDAQTLIFNRYGIEKGTLKNSDGTEVADTARIIPAGMPRSTAIALFRDLIAQDMADSSEGGLLKRTNREPLLDNDEKKAVILNDSEACRRVQAEGEAPPDD